MSGHVTKVANVANVAGKREAKASKHSMEKWNFEDSPLLWKNASEHFLYNASSESNATTLDDFPDFDNITLQTFNNISSIVSISLNVRRFTTLEIVIYSVLAVALSVVTIVGNLLLLVSVIYEKSLQTASNWFLFSLAVADFTVGLISMPLFALFTLLGYWPLGEFACDAWLSTDYMASNSSMLHLLIISYDRYYAISWPLKYRANMRTRYAKRAIAVAWILSFLVWPPWIFLVPMLEGRKVPEKDCYIQFIITQQYLTYVTAILAFYIPATIMVVLYYRIYKTIGRRKEEFAATTSGSTGALSATVVTNLECSKRSTSSDENAIAQDAFSYEMRMRTPSNPSRSEKFSPIINRNGKFLQRRDIEGKNVWNLMKSWFVACRWQNNSQPASELTTPISAEERALPSSRLLQSSRSESIESIYTVLIRLPAEGCEGAGGRGPSIKMFPEDTSSKRWPTYERTFSIDTQRPSTLGDSRLTLNASNLQQKTSVGGGISRFTVKQALNAQKKSAAEKKDERKAATMLSAIIATFIVTWTPYNVLVLFKSTFLISDGIWELAYYLCYLNSTINPVLYALCNENFRRTYLRILTVKCWKKRPWTR